MVVKEAMPEKLIIVGMNVEKLKMFDGVCVE